MTSTATFYFYASCGMGRCQRQNAEKTESTEMTEIQKMTKIKTRVWIWGVCYHYLEFYISEFVFKKVASNVHHPQVTLIRIHRQYLFHKSLNVNYVNYVTPFLINSNWHYSLFCQLSFLISVFSVDSVFSASVFYICRLWDWQTVVSGAWKF